MIITVMKKAHELHEFHEKKIKIIRVNSCNSWASFFHSSPGADAYHHKELPEE
jgi:hypothetical protein